MKSSMMILSGAAAVMAGPILNREVEVVVQVVTQVVTDVVQYTVTAVAEATPDVAIEYTTADPVIVTVTADSEPVATTPAVEPVVVTVTADTTTAAAETPAVDYNVAVAATTSSTEEAATSTAAAAASSPTDFKSTALYHHNVHRANASASDVTYSDDLASFAATLSARCVFEHDVTIGINSEFPSYGQNIAMYAATDIENLTVEKFLAQSISDYWYNNELELYPNSYGSEPDMTDFEGWGHYSQVVWAGTKQMGCAIQYCEAGTMASGMAAYMSTCNYYPAGNVDTEYAANVLKPLGNAVVTA